MLTYDNFDKKVGEGLKRLRNEKRLTLRQVGEIFDINNSTIARWESGENSISAKLLFKYLEFYGITYEDFISSLK